MSEAFKTRRERARDYAHADFKYAYQAESVRLMEEAYLRGAEDEADAWKAEVEHLRKDIREARAQATELKIALEKISMGGA